MKRSFFSRSVIQNGSRIFFSFRFSFLSYGWWLGNCYKRPQFRGTMIRVFKTKREKRKYNRTKRSRRSKLDHNRIPRRVAATAVRNNIATLDRFVANHLLLNARAHTHSHTHSMSRWVRWYVIVFDERRLRREESTG